MELVSIMLLLLRRRLLVAAGLVLAVVLGAFAGGVLPPHSTRAASPGSEALAQVLLDTPVSQTASSDRALIGAETILKRGILLGDLVGADAQVAAIAQQAAVKPDQLALVTPSFDPVSASTYLPAGQLPVRAARAARTAVHQPYVVTITAQYTVPILSVAAAAPDGAHAAALVAATITALRSQGTGVRIEQLGPIQTAPVAAAPGTHHARGAAAAGVLFALWCIAVVFAEGLRRAWRRPDPRTGLRRV